MRGSDDGRYTLADEGFGVAPGGHAEVAKEASGENCRCSSLPSRSSHRRRLAGGTVGWLDAASGYQVRLAENGKIQCRNGKGKLLSSTPASIKDDPQVVQRRQLAEWLTRHEAECLSAVDGWMVRSLPVPAALLTEVWADAAWAAALRDLVVTADGGSGAETGFLRDVDPEKGFGVVT